MKELATQRPTIVVNTGLIDEDFTISALFPVALIARPSLVLKKNTRKTITMATAMKATTISPLPLAVYFSMFLSSWKIPSLFCSY